MGNGASAQAAAVGNQAAAVGNQAAAVGNHAVAAAQSLAAGVGRASAAYTATLQAAAGTPVGSPAVVTGAGDGYRSVFNGGAETDSLVADLKDYRSSRAAEVHEKLVRSVAHAMKNQGFAGITPDADLMTVSQQLRDKIPSPARGNTFGSDAKKHETSCRAVAKALNSQLSPGAKKGEQLIDEGAGAATICRRVSELVEGMTSGMHTEFLQVQGSVTKSLRDLQALDQLMRMVHDEVDGELLKDATSDTRRQVEPMRDAYVRLRAQRDQAVQVLSGLLDTVLLPASEELQLVMAEQDELYRTLKDADLVPGTSGFGRQLAAMVAGLGTMSVVSARTQRALKTVGSTMEQYAASDNWRDFDESLNSMRFSAPADAAKFETATAQLRATFWNRKELAASASRGGFKASEAAGGAEEPTELDRRLKKRDLERKLILRQYFERTRAAYDKLLKGVSVVGPRLGRDIPVSDSVNRLRDALQRMVSVSGDARIDLNLIGYYTSAQSRTRRDEFLNHLRLIDASLEGLLAGPGGEAFQTMRSAIQDLVKVIDHYTDVGKATFGGDGVDGGDIEGDLKLAESARSSLDLKSSINEFVYYIYVAGVRENLSYTGKEIGEYGARYEEVLGDAVAGRLQQLRTEKADLLNETGDADGTKIGKGDDVNLGHLNGGGFPVITMADWTALKDAITLEYKTKTEFYEVLQAVDLYMKAFAQGIAEHPDDIASIKRELDGVELIGKWFTEKSGDSLYEFFEEGRPLAGLVTGVSPLADGTHTAAITAAAVAAGGAGNTQSDHYYGLVAAQATGIGGALRVGTVGGVMVSRILKLRAKAEEALRTQQSLKNLINCFSRIGRKFGGQELAQQTFMSPTVMWRRLQNFITVSAVSTRGTLGAITRVAGAAQQQAPSDAQAMFLCYPTPAQTNGGLVSNWATENMFFQFIIKAIAAKVLTVVGTFDLFERPEPILELTPTRVILGGAEAPEIIPAATELYFRLPRLAEFYLEMFEFSTAPGVDEKKISMLPELGGTFGPLISQVFIRAAAAARTGEYSESEVENLVAAINPIYDKYKDHGDACCKHAVQGFVAEINRRYAIVKKSEYEKYTKAYISDTRYASTFAAQGEITNYAILPGEENMGLDGEERGRLAPSARYMGPNGTVADVKYAPGKYSLDSDNAAADSMWQIMSQFRGRLMEVLDSPDARKGYGRVSYSSVIEQARLAIEGTSDPRNRMEHVLRIVQGSDLVSGTNQGRALAFHETVVMGLNTLTVVCEQLRRFRTEVAAMDIAAATKAVGDHIDAAAKATPPTVPTNCATMAAMHANVVATGGRTLDIKYMRDNGDGRNLSQIEPQPNAPALGDPTITAMYARVALAPPAGSASGARLVRYVFDRQQVMRDLFLATFKLSADFDELVTVRFPGSTASKISLDFNGLRTLAESLMNDVRFFINHFRGSFDQATISKFEGPATSYGTLAWLETELIDSLFKGETNVGGAATGDLVTLARVNQQLNGILVELTRDHEGGVDWANNNWVASAAGAPPVFDQYGTVFSGLAFWDGTLDESGIDGAVSPIGAAFPSMSLLIVGARPPGAAATAVNPRLTAGDGATDLTTSIPVYAGPGINANNRSMMLVFNQLLARWLQQYFDVPSSRIYNGLIDAFANGAFSQSVMDPMYTQPDLFVGGQGIPAIGGAAAVPPTFPGFGRRGDPTAQSIIFTSLATIMQRVVRDQTQQGSAHLVSTLAEVPTYMKESFRATLPVFNKLFGLLLKEGEFLTEFIERARVQCGRPSMVPTAAAAGAMIDSLHPAIATTTALTEGITLHPLADEAGNVDTIVRRRIMDVVGAVNGACFTMCKIADEVLRELSDEPVFFETANGSIQAYRSRYNTMPLMPASLMTNFLSGTPDGMLTDDMGPSQAVNSPSFQRLYGVRGIFAPKGRIGLEQMPGAKAIAEEYNSGTSQREQLDVQRYAGFVEGAAKLVRYVVNARSYSAALVAVNTTSFTQGVAYVGGVGAAEQAWAMKSTPAQVLGAVDSSYQEDKIADMTRGLTEVGGLATGDLGKRSTERTNNIIDLNIMPINVHALMRSMPLAPLYNYSYSFEELVCSFLNSTRSEVLNVDNNAAAPGAGFPDDTKGFFLKLLLAPYETVSRAVYGDETNIRGTAGFGNRMFRGDNGLGMGRPRYLSDQVFNKALFGSIWLSKRDYDEAGPSGLTSRGREGWGGKLSSALTPPEMQAYGTALDSMRAGNWLVSVPTTLDQLRQLYEDAWTNLETRARNLLAITPFNVAGPAQTAATAIADRALRVRDAFRDIPWAMVTDIPGVSNAGNIAAVVQPAIVALTTPDATALPFEIFRADLVGGVLATPRYFGAVVGAPGTDVNSVLSGVALALAFGATIAQANALRNPMPATAADAEGRLIVLLATLFIQRNLVEHTSLAVPITVVEGATGAAAMATAAALAVAVQPADHRMGDADSGRVEAHQLTYLKKDKTGMDRIEEVRIDPNYKVQLQAVGLDRFNTALVRNLVLLGNVNRILRAKFSREMAEQRSILQRGNDLVAVGFTEYAGSDTFGDKEYFSERSLTGPP